MCIFCYHEYLYKNKEMFITYSVEQIGVKSTNEEQNVGADRLEYRIVFTQQLCGNGHQLSTWKKLIYTNEGRQELWTTINIG